MPQRALRHLLKKDRNVQLLIETIAKRLNEKLTVVTTENKLLWGTEPCKEKRSFAIRDAQQTHIATLYGESDDGQLLADLISNLLIKELAKKKMGAEVLGLYREINMIYDFSEKISEHIDATSIAEIALAEASQIIRSARGLFLMYNAAKDEVSNIASFGVSEHQTIDLQKYDDQLKQIIRSGQSAIVSGANLKYLKSTALKSLMYAPLKVKHRKLGAILLGRYEALEFTAAELKLLTTIASQSAAAIESARLYQRGLKEAQEREDAVRKVHDASAKFVPFEFIKSLGRTNLTEVSLGDLVEREVTVVFADIRDFTSFSEELSPQDNFLFVNGFNERMGPIVRRNHGFISQYLGDGFMAIFTENPEDALRASVEMHRTLDMYNAQRQIKNRKPIRIGVGMQIGKLIMGITGDVERMDAATISDTVNTAARIEGLSKHYGTSILLTEDCKNKLISPGEFDFRYLGLVQVKGKQMPIKLFECFNGDSKDLYDHKIKTLQTFNEGMKKYFQREFAMAAVTFQQIVKKHKKDTTAKLLLNRSAHLITQDLAEDWDGVDYNLH